jgi:3-oxoacyl-[acyl-carrier protein] reductase
MSDRYSSLARTPVGQFVVRNLGLPNPPRLVRYCEGQPLVDGTVLVGGTGKGRLLEVVPSLLSELSVDVALEAAVRTAYRGIVFDASGITDPASLVALQQFFSPALRSLGANGRIVVLGSPPEQVADGERIAQRALEGFTRSLGKEVGRGSTVQLVYVAPGAERSVTSTLAFLLSAKSAYVSGQVIRVGSATVMPPPPIDWQHPLNGKVALVTGASRGIGASIARTLRRDGATVVGLDVASAAGELQELMSELDGTAISLDITSRDAPQRIAAKLTAGHGGVDIVVHNAGITRDRRLVNMDANRFASAVAVNLVAPQRITEHLLSQDVIRSGGRVLGVASIAGIAGNLGQTNYATSKAGVIGLVSAMTEPAGNRQVTVNAVAPGFIETQMTATIPLPIREAGRRMNSLRQGGLPVDVAETIAWLASPGSSGITGNVVRVCGQSLLGA